MSKRFNKKLLLLELEKARQTGALVDLRKKTEVIEPTKASPKKEKKAKLNFLFKPKRRTKSLFSQRVKASNRNIKTKAKKEKFSFNLFQKPSRKKVAKLNFPYKSNVWRKRIKLKQKSFNRPFSFKTKPKAMAVKLSVYRSLFSFILVLLLIIVPLKLLSFLQVIDLTSIEERLFVHSEAALSELQQAGLSVSSLDFSQASSNFSAASEQFLQAESELALINSSLLKLSSLSSDPKYKLASEAKNILSAGVLASQLGQNLSQASGAILSSEKIDFAVKVDAFSLYARQAILQAQELQRLVGKIKIKHLPLEYQDQFLDLSAKLDFLATNLDQLIEIVNKIADLLGKSQDKRYLLIFQNNAEIRASGGFLGSYALVDFKQGKIKKLEVPAGGSYDTEGGLRLKIKSPEPLWLVNPLWHFWDANWWPDWPTTAKNLIWFYEKSGGSTVDGIISLTPNVLEDLLEITGPIDLSEEYGVIIEADNFWEIIQKIVEHDNLVLSNPDEVINFSSTLETINSDLPLYQDLENNIDNKPKKIIGDLMVRLMEILPEQLDQENIFKLISLFEANIASKQILFYFSDPTLQADLSKHNLAAEIKETKQDYLQVVNTNIAGQKTDRTMADYLNLETEVESDGSIINHLTIKREHQGIKNQALSGVRNVNWLRVYVPLGSRLISAQGFSTPDSHYFSKPEPDWLDSDLLIAENQARFDADLGVKIYEENDKTVFAAWVMTDPGETAEVEFSYQLPFNFFNQTLTLNKTNQGRLTDNFKALFSKSSQELLEYSLLLQKQPGAKTAQFEAKLKLPFLRSPYWQYPEQIQVSSQGWQINDKIDSDKYYYLLLND